MRAILRRVRAIVRRALPGAEEAISYGIPTYRLHGTYVLYFAAWKDHYSLYPVSDRIVADIGADLRPYRVRKGTVRFPLDEPVPEKLIASIAKHLGRHAADRAAAKATRKKAGRARRAPAGRG
jgi:uncharacterized protein YdhG (YjbR/CyaY superfamily)